MGITYLLSHLDEFQMQVLDNHEIPRINAVTFEDHCFTETPQQHNSALEYLGAAATRVISVLSDINPH